MAHIEKYTMSSVYALLHHDLRKVSDTCKRKNENIDKTRTHLNKIYLDNTKQFKSRLDEIKIQKRKDVNVACSCVVTLPAGITEQRQIDEFFENVIKHLTEKYKRENVICAVVHNDETTPHLHFMFVPAVRDMKEFKKSRSGKLYKNKNFGKEKLCCAELINKEHLKTFHRELQEYLDKNLSFRTRIVNEVTLKDKKEFNKTVDELKNDTKNKILEAEKEKNRNAGVDLEQEYIKNQLLETEMKKIKEKRENLLEKIDEDKKIVEKMLADKEIYEQLAEKRIELINENKNLDDNIVLLNKDVENKRSEYNKNFRTLVQYKHKNDDLLRELNLNVDVTKFIDEYKKMQAGRAEDTEKIKNILSVLHHKIAGIGKLITSRQMNNISAGIANMKKLMDNVGKAKEQSTLADVEKIIDETKANGVNNGQNAR